MPAESERQRRWAFAVMGEDWARKHHFDRLRRKKKQPPKRRRRRPPSS